MWNLFSEFKQTIPELKCDVVRVFFLFLECPKYCFAAGILLSNRLWNYWVSDVTLRGQVLNFSPSFQGMSNNFEVKEVSSKVIAVKTLIGEWSDNCASGNGTLNVQHIQFSRQGNTEKVPKQFRRKKFSNLYFKKRKLIFFSKELSVPMSKL